MASGLYCSFRIAFLYGLGLNVLSIGFERLPARLESCPVGNGRKGLQSNCAAIAMMLHIENALLVSSQLLNRMML